MPGLFLCFEGIDGCGKSTQIVLLTNWLEAQGLTVVRTREPGGTPLGEQLRTILLHQEETSLCMTSEMLLYMASRAQLMQDVIHPALAEGKVVIADRFLLSNVVYQGSAGGLTPVDIWSVGKLATSGTKPDLTLLLDLTPEQASARLPSELDRLESRGLEYMAQVRAGYMVESEKTDAGSVEVIDASLSPEEMHAKIKQVVEPKLADVGE